MKKTNDELELIRAFNEYTLTDEFKLEFITYSELLDEQYDAITYGLAKRKETNELAILIILEDHSDDEPLFAWRTNKITQLATRKFKNFIYVPDDQNPGKFVLEESDDELFTGNSKFETYGHTFFPVYDVNVLHGGELEAEWKPYDSTYEISNFGAVRNTITKKLLLPVAVKSGGHIYNIKGKPMTAAKMVANTFIGNAPSNDMVVIHINSNSYDNRVCNLKWGTKSDKFNEESIKKMSRTRTFLYTFGPDAKTNRNKLSVAAKARCAAGNNNALDWKNYHIEVIRDNGTVEKFNSVREYAKLYGFNPSRIYPYIKSGRHFDSGMCRIRRVKNK